MTAILSLLQISEIHSFRKTFLSFRYQGPITRQQVLFLCWLIARGMTTNFRAKDVEALGIEYNLGHKYLERLSALGFAKKDKWLWTITLAGIQYYQDFAKEFQAKASGSFKWG